MNHIHTSIRSFYRLMSEQDWWRAFLIIVGLYAMAQAAEIYSMF